ncbi:hypothetical protein [Azospira sp. I09]|uniref:hypothetical protein n=1 Tax=Azospira sp. I09 TaxID=1765049 RepID=UPI001260AFAC|nr:hypothetical protein [Azospira sp. I09]BBN89781.1 hypothetical protein AZSP09_28040 [Azospira sp. I09]
MQRHSRSASSGSPAAPAAPASPRRPKRRAAPFLASVRFLDGSRNVYEVSNAKDVADARRMILEELSNVAAAMIVVRD